MFILHKNRNDKSSITEYFADDDTLTNDGIDVTIGVGSLIPKNVYKIVPNNIEDTLIILCHDDLDTTNNTAYTPDAPVTATNADTIIIYKYFLGC